MREQMRQKAHSRVFAFEGRKSTFLGDLFARLLRDFVVVMASGVQGGGASEGVVVSVGTSVVPDPKFAATGGLVALVSQIAVGILTAGELLWSGGVLKLVVAEVHRTMDLQLSLTSDRTFNL